jgi:hypothetical protein
MPRPDAVVSAARGSSRNYPTKNYRSRPDFALVETGFFGCLYRRTRGSFTLHYDVRHTGSRDVFGDFVAQRG